MEYNKRGKIGEKQGKCVFPFEALLYAAKNSWYGTQMFDECLVKSTVWPLGTFLFILMHNIGFTKLVGRGGGH
jgi:hypothetical protein